mmetsp:Transcript_4861/g.8450  ORF Transcript_4861/g.8450 Transcript_4861/m.8450 type:complete len:278 (-) Transcript_4861:12-845(-)
MVDARQVLIRAAAPCPAEEGEEHEVAAPGQMAMVVGGQTLVTGPAAKAYSLMAAQPRMQIRQQRQLIEAFINFEVNNQYVMRGADGKDLFFLKENSSCMERNCCRSRCSAWRMDIFLLGPRGLEGSERSMVPFMHLGRPCSMTCMCVGRPEVEISELPSGRIVGYIVEPFACCQSPFFTLHDHERNPVLRSKVPCCSPGLCCRCPCHGVPCNEVQFPVNDFETKEMVAMVRKFWMWGDLCWWLGEWDNYWAEFGAINHPDYKALVLGLAIYIQMRFF